MFYIIIVHLKLFEPHFYSSLTHFMFDCKVIDSIQTILYTLFPWRMWWLISTIVGIVGLVLLVLAIIGIINAAQGKAKELPLVGSFNILKV